MPTHKGNILFVTDSVQVEPLGIMYLSSALKQAGYNTSFAKCELKNHADGRKELLHDLVVNNLSFPSNDSNFPGLIAFSVTTGRHQKFVEIAKVLKQWGNNECMTLFGGPHPTYFPEMIEEDAVDSICIGEGEKAIVEFADALFNERDPSQIPNIYVKNGSEIYRNQVRALNKNIDEFSFPDRDLIPNNDGIYHLITSRGCPYNCTYCYNHIWKQIYANGGDPIRIRSPQNVIEEILELDKDKVSMIYFQDDIFGIRLSWLREFAGLYKSIGIPFHCHLRPEFVTHERITLLSEMGCHSITMGMETADARIRLHILNRKTNNESIKKAVITLRKFNIKFRLLNMIGLPTETLSDALKTYSFAKKMNPTYSWCSILQPYPKTKLGQLCENLGFYDGDVNNFHDNFFFDSSIYEDTRYTKLRCLFPLGNALRLPKLVISLLIRLPIYGLLIWLYKKHRNYVDKKLLVFRKQKK